MRLFRNAPIRKKLMGIAMLTTAVALLLAGTAFIVYELAIFRSAMTRELVSTADILGTNSTAALTFDDPMGAELTLQGLRAIPRIMSAAIYTKEGKLFAAYHRGDAQPEAVPARPGADGDTLEGMRLVLFRPIVLDRERIGTIWLQSDLREVAGHLMLYAIVSIVVLLASSALALFVSSRLQQMISEPVQHLARTVKAVSETRDYSIRAQGSGHDELSLLTDGLNEMLAQIQERDIALQHAHDTLEERVQKRTTELQREVVVRRQAEGALASQIEELAQLNALLEERERELQQTLQKLAETQAELIQSEKLASLGFLVAGVAHELNNPISFVHSNIDFIGDYVLRLKGLIATSEALELPEGQTHQRLEELKAEARRDVQTLDELIASCKRGTERVKKIVMDLGTFARADEVTPVAVDLHEGIETTLSLLTKEYKNRITVHRAYGSLPPVECHPGQINQVFMNLLLNAAQAIPETGEIWISTAAQGEKVNIVIQDNGCGIPEANLQKVFDPFFTTKKVGEGMGLGLSISYGIIQKHGGNMRVSSHNRQGTEFTIELPVKWSGV